MKYLPFVLLSVAVIFESSIAVLPFVLLFLLIYAVITRSELHVGLRTQTKITQLRNILTVDNLKIMTGVLSETDVKIIASVSGGGIDINGSDEAMIDELTRMRDALQGEGVQPESGVNAQQTQQQLPAGVRSITKVK